MSDFRFFAVQGAQHITDLNGYDHILFVLALCAVYPLRRWRTVAWLVTAFTVGHSIALALATLGLVVVDSAWVEFLIPVTILATCLYNIFILEPTQSPRSITLQYGIVTFFGLIHGLGFSNFIREMLLETESLFVPLLSFNIGLEIGQLLIVAAALLLNYLFISVVKMPFRWWKLGLSTAIGILALWLAIERI